VFQFLLLNRHVLSLQSWPREAITTCTKVRWSTPLTQAQPYIVFPVLVFGPSIPCVTMCRIAHEPGFETKHLSSAVCGYYLCTANQDIRLSHSAHRTYQRLMFTHAHKCSPSCVRGSCVDQSRLILFVCGFYWIPVTDKVGLTAYSCFQTQMAALR